MKPKKKKQNFASPQGMFASLLAAASVASVQSAFADDSVLFPAPGRGETTLNRFGVSYSMGFHITRISRAWELLRPAHSGTGVRRRAEPAV